MGGTTHPVLLALGAAVTLQCVAQAFHLFHLCLYWWDGVGVPWMDLFSEVLFMLSQVANATLFITIAQGYTLFCSRMRQLGTVWIVLVVVAILHVVLVGLGKLQGDTSCKHHENEGFVGWVLLAVRLLLNAWFTSGVQALKKSCRFRLFFFLRQFQFAGSVYFISYPMLVIVVQVFAPYLRHPIMQLGLLAMQSASSLWLADLFLSRGEYFEMSSLNSSLLPGCTGLFVGS